jgi:uncharacterized protein YlxW (UPF0749 family)
MKNKGSRILMVLMCIVLGIMVSLQLKSSLAATTGIPSSTDLVKQVANLKSRNEELTSKVDEYEKKINEYVAGTASESKVVDNLQKELDNAKKLSGLTDVEGPGIEITLTPIKEVLTNETVSIKSSDLLDVINELNSSGAEAISINGERFTARTQIREAGYVLKINDTAFSPTEPFTIKAIGDSDVLAGAFKLPQGVKDRLKSYAIDMTITESEKVTIPKYSKTLKYEYVK